MDIFFERLKELREEKEVTQKEVAVAIGVTQKAVAYWEKGEKIPSAQVLKFLAEYFGVTTDYLLGLED